VEQDSSRRFTKLVTTTLLRAMAPLVRVCCGAAVCHQYPRNLACWFNPCSPAQSSGDTLARQPSFRKPAAGTSSRQTFRSRLACIWAQAMGAPAMGAQAKGGPGQWGAESKRLSLPAVGCLQGLVHQRRGPPLKVATTVVVSSATHMHMHMGPEWSDGRQQVSVSACCDLPAQSWHTSGPPSRRSRVTCCGLHVASCRLHAASCHMHAAS